MPYISENGREKLRRYKYSVIDKSLMAPYFQPFWNTFVQVFPKWFAPNLITCSGMGLEFISMLLGWWYSPTLDSHLPTSIIFAHGILLFLYQTFDAVDGKQARRTGSSSPLGELCDHTVDALVLTLAALSCGSTLRIHANFEDFERIAILLLWMIAAAAFAVTTWETYLTGVMTLPELNGPNEGLLVLYALHLFTAAVGAQDRVWGPLFLLRGRQVSGVDLIMLSTALGALADVALRLHGVAARGRRGGAHRSTAHAAATLAPVFGLFAALLGWAWLSPGDALGRHPYFFMFGAGFAFAYLMARLILAHLTGDSEHIVAHLWSASVPSALGMANAAAARWLGVTVVGDERWLLGVALAVSAYKYISLARGVAGEVCDTLGIRVFSLRRGGAPKLVGGTLLAAKMAAPAPGGMGARNNGGGSRHAD